MSVFCPNCQTENRDAANYCKRCSTLLATHCPRCQAVVQEDAFFCDNCRLPFATPYPADNLFPQATGPPASEGKPPPKISPPQIPDSQLPDPGSGKLERLITQEMRAKLDSAREKKAMVGERRIVTVLFCDVKGSTAAAGKLDPEDWAEIMNGCFEHMINPIYKYEGTVARLMGDAILAFFGAPIAHEDDPHRSILAGLEIVQDFSRYSDQVLSRWEIDFNIRVGINTGTVMVGQVGSDLQMEYTAMGDAINIASRMEQTAKPGTIQISSDTHKYVANAFEFEDLGLVEVKGKEKPVQTYRPLSRKMETGKTRGIEGMQTPMVGRESEWSRLKTAAQAVSRGIGQIVFLVGEAGLGKSRLMEELKISWDQDPEFERDIPDVDGLGPPTDWYQTAALSFETGKPYGIFQRLMRRMMGSKTDDSVELQRELIDTIIKSLPGEDRSAARKAFESMFGMVGKNGSPPLEGEEFKQELFKYFHRVWEFWAGKYPIILALDDLHWADPASIELLKHLFSISNEYPIMFLCATRPERNSATWELQQFADDAFSHRYTGIKIHPLSEEFSGQLVESLMADSDLSESLRTRILEKTEGNPFFVEEVVRTLLISDSNDGKGISPFRLSQIEKGEIDIPDNIQSLLTARIDRLQDDVRRTLQLAALIGRSFYFNVLEKIASDLPEEILPEHLTILQKMDLIREAARHPELEYSFKQALTQEAAYNTILLKQRRDFHRQVAEAIEDLFDDQLVEMAATLARHFDQAEVYEKAMQYSVIAGNEAYRLYAIPLAIDHYNQALGYLEKFDPDSGQIKFLFSRLGRAYELDSNFLEALRVYEKLESISNQLNDPSLALASLVARSTIYSNVNDQGDPEKGWQLSRDALTLAEDLQDEETEAKILWNHLNSLRFTDKVGQAVKAGERALALARKLDIPQQQAKVANDLSLALVAAGQPDRACDVLKEARELFRELENKPMLADSLATASMVHSFQGDYEPAIQFSEESYQISYAIKNNWGLSYSRFGIGNIYWQQGNPDKAIEMLETVLSYGEKAHFLVAGAWAQAHLALIYNQLGNTEKSFALAKGALEHASRYSPAWRPLSLGIMAQVCVTRGEYDQASEQIKESEKDTSSAYGTFLSIYQVNDPAVRVALFQEDFDKAEKIASKMVEDLRKYQFDMYLPEALRLLGKVSLARGNEDLAIRNLEEARKLAEKQGAVWALWKIYRSIAAMYNQKEEPKKAQRMERKAQEYFDRIAHNLADQNLLAAFKTRAGV